KDPISWETNGCNINIRLAELASGRSGRGVWARIEAGAKEYRRMAGARLEDGPCDPAVLLAYAYPERVAKARPDGCGHFIMASGEPVRIDVSDPMSSCDWIVAPAVSTKAGGEGRVFLAAEADPKSLGSLIRERDVLGWDSTEGRVVARHEWNIGCLTIDSKPSSIVAREEICSVIAKAAPKEGLSMFDFSNPKVENLQRRIAAVSAWHPELEIPAVDTASILGKASEWLPMFIGSASSIQSLKKIDLEEVIWSITGYGNRLEIERLAPSSVVVPTGSEIRLEYRAGADAPVLRVRLQECFGLLDTPRVDGGRLPVLMELLSPGFKPVQLTSDLRSFWSGTYFEVRKELRRRYPKHSWPDDPLAAVPVRGLPRKNNC
ncbi:MAG: ATP-dependent helicase HrpB, partial [Bacteroidales bacterium]|nr:ATP-dependent helicase HrpB [Bacteroidales bacterium]